MKKCLIALSFVAACAATASASTITLTGSYPDATHWQVVAQDSTGDNSGIFSTGFSITGISTLAFRTPTATFSDDGTASGNLATFGFTSKLTGPSGTNNNALNPANVYTYSAGQGLSDPANDYVYGYGQTSGNTSNLEAPPGYTLLSSQTYNLPALVFNGTRPSNGQVSFVIGSGNGTVFKVSGAGAGTNLDPTATAVLQQFPVVPEPASMVLMGLAGVGLVFVARRSKK